MTYINDTKPTRTYPNIAQGQAMGLLLVLTYATQIITNGFIADAKPGAGSYVADTKPA